MFQIQCNNKGCWEYQKPVLDIVKNDDGEVNYTKSLVICSECGKSIDSVTEFSKRAMRGLGQIKRSSSPKKAFAVECQKCNQKDQPVLMEKQKGKPQEVSCPHCAAPHDKLPAPFKQTVIQFLGSKL